MAKDGVGRLRSRVRHPVLICVGAVFLFLIATVAIALSITNWNFARGALSSWAGNKLDRRVTIGSISARLWSAQPRVRVQDLSIANPDWTAGGDIAQIDSIDVAVDLRELLRGELLLDALTIDNPRIALINDTQGRANFRFGKQQGMPGTGSESPDGAEPPKLPAMRRFTVRGGELRVRDDVRKLTFRGQVDASEHAESGADAFRLLGTGTLNSEPFELQFKGAALVNVRTDQPYPFDAKVLAGKTHGTVRGAFTKPFDFGRLVADVDVQGQNLAHLYNLTNLALPFTPPYRLAGELRSTDRQIAVRKLQGKVGSSDLNGDVRVDVRGARPKLYAKLRSQSLNLADLSPAFGKGVRINPETGDALDSVAPAPLPPDKLLPTYRFQFDRLRSMDAQVELHAAAVKSSQVPFTGVVLALRLTDGVLALNPLRFTLPQGTIAGTVRIDARDKIAKTELDVHVSNVQLEQMKGKSMPQPPLAGTLQARLQLAGSGNSVHDIFTHGDGKLIAVVPRGEVRQAFAELTGINAARGLGLLLTKDQKQIGVRCGVAAFDIRQGTAAAERIVFDTDTVLIKGSGKVNLDSEALDLEIAGKPKKVRLLRLRTPITLGGSLRDPDVGVDAGDTAKQAGIAGAVGALVSPLTALLAFIDPGLAKDADCGELLAEAEQEKESAPVKN
jgi:AsmA family protein